MSTNYQKWILEGNLLRDPEMRYTPKGHPVTTLLLACSHVHQNSDGKRVDELVIYKAYAWNGLAEAANHFLQKGAHLLIEALPVVDQSEEGAKRGHPKIWFSGDGTPHADLECKILKMHMLGSQKAAASSSHPESAEESSNPPPEKMPEEAGDDEFSF